MSEVDPKLVSQYLKSVRGRNLPKGLAPQTLNEDKSPDGRYEGEGLADPGIIGRITGSGNGRFLGR